MEPGATMMLTIDLAPGHYAVVCNLRATTPMGMHQDLWVTPPGSTPVTVGLGRDLSTQMSIHLSQTSPRAR